MDILAQIRYKAMDFLSRREHSRKELREKLRKSFVEQDVIELALDGLENDGLQSDSRFVESYIRHRIGAGYGPMRIKAELRQRGISDAMIRSGLEECSPDWLLEADRVWAKKFGQMPSEPKERARQQRFLAYRGFPGDIIQELLS